MRVRGADMRELKIERIREMTEDDIIVKIRDLKGELLHLRFRNTMRQLQNPLLLREKRRGGAALEPVLKQDLKGTRPLTAGPGTPPPPGAKDLPTPPAPPAAPTPG